MIDAFKYVIAKGIETEKAYPYKAQAEKCRADPAKFVFHIKGYNKVAPLDNPQLQAAVDQQPVSIGVDAESLQFYKKGIISTGCGQNVDHAVLLVGYGADAGKDFWKVKNSWGQAWGELGYFRVLRKTGTNQRSQCGVNLEASYPTGGSK